MPANFEDAFERVKQLAADFKANEKFYLSPAYQEAEARRDFVDKFLLALGWDVNHDTQKNPYEQEVKVERKEHGVSQRRFGRNQNLGIQQRQKICVPRLVDQLCAAYAASGIHFLDNVDVGGVTFKPGYEKQDLRYLLALLNSRLLRWYFPFVSAPFRGGWMSANKQFLSQLPFQAIDFSKSADKARYDKLVSLVEQMLAAKPQFARTQSDKDKDFYANKCAALDRQIDALVYELYSLTEDEIKIVEGAAQ
jgi:hypothetical protein